MKNVLYVAAITAVVFGVVVLERQTVAQSNLNICYGANGIQQLSYAGVLLEDLAQYPSDSFHIWHMKMTDLQGNLMPGGQFSWGETNNGRSWNQSTNTWTYNYVWGAIQVQFVQRADVLDMIVTETNRADSNAILDGAVIYPFGLHFPKLPDTFYDASYPQLAFNTTAPSVTLADYGSGEVLAVVPDGSKALYSGFLPIGNGIAYSPITSGTAPDGLATFLPHNDRRVLPGQIDTFTVSLRFAPSGTSSTTLAADAYSNWAQTWPALLNWSDRRPIGTIYLASSPSGDDRKPGGYPNNPRRYFNSSSANDFDIRTTAGLSAFQRRVLEHAANNVTNLQRLKAQGAITWDIEGEEYPQSTSYACAPDSIAQIAPEMESVILDRNSQYFGSKLDDAYFKIITSTGFRVGVCVRPQHFTQYPDGTAQQVYLANTEIAAELIRKIRFAHDRWGATLFYVDSTVESNGAVLDASIFQQVSQAFPDSLIMPEETTPKYFAYTAPFQTFIFHGDLGTDTTVHTYYTRAFSVNLINDVDPAKLAAKLPQLTASVKGGDILMGHVDYWDANNGTILSIYDAAGVSTDPPGTTTPPVVTPTPTPQPTPAPTTPTPTPIGTTSRLTILTPAEGATISGSVNVTGAVELNLDAAGSYLMVDGVEIGTKRVTSAPFNYPLDTTTLSDGQHVLQLWARDTGNTTSLSNAVKIAVANGVAVITAPSPNPTPVPLPPSNPTPIVTPPVPTITPTSLLALTFPVAGQGISGLVAVRGEVLRTLDAAGSYLMVDGVEFGSHRLNSAPYIYSLDTALLSVGEHLLQLWAHDINNETLLSNQVTISVAR